MTAAKASWEGLLLAHLEKHKRYPRSAQRRNVQGTAFLHFAMDRNGKVLRYALVTSSGSEVLDEEVLEMIERAQPLPALPPEMPGAAAEYTVPINFDLR
jgi:protein TonB